MYQSRGRLFWLSPSYNGVADASAQVSPASYVDAHGLYPLALSLIPQLELGPGQLDDVDAYWGMYDALEGPEGLEFRGADPSDFLSGDYLDPFVELQVPATAADRIRYYDVVRCPSETLTVLAGASTTRVYELARVQVPEGFVGVVEHIETAIRIQKATLERAVSLVQGKSYRHVTGNLGNWNFAAAPGPLVENDPCPWPDDFELETTGLPNTPLTVDVEYTLGAQGTTTFNGVQLPTPVIGGAPTSIPASMAPFGPFRWSDQRFAHGLPTYGARQWLLRGPTIVRFFASVSVTNSGASDADLEIGAYGRLSGFVQAGSTGRDSALHSATHRHP